MPASIAPPIDRAVGNRSLGGSRNRWRLRALALTLGPTLAITYASDVRAQLTPIAAAAPATEIEIRGRVIDPDGRPLGGVTVRLVATGRSVRTDRGGWFRLAALQEGTHLVRVQSSGYRGEEVLVRASAAAEPVVLTLLPSPLEIPGIVVTANPLRSGAVYQASQLLEADQLERLSGPSVGTMLDGQPGLSSRYLGAAPARPVIRGFDGERVVVLENGERMGDTQERAPDDAVSLDPLAIERIEVVRGPASLLHGSSALGGVVNLVTRDLPESWGEGLSGDVVLQHSQVNSMAASSARLLYGAGRWGASARGSARASENLFTPSGVLPNSHLETLSGALGVGHQGERFRGAVGMTFHSQEYGVPEFAVVADPNRPGRYLEVEPESQVLIDRTTVQSRAEWHLGRWIQGAEFRSTISVSNQEEGEAGKDDADEEPEQEIRTRLVSSTLLLRHAPFAMIAEGALGLNLRLQRQQIEGTEAYHPGQQLLSVASFFFEELPLGRSVRLQLGGRMENEWTRTLPNSLFPPEITGSVTALNLSGSAGVNVRPGAGIELGAQLARAHRNPTVLERFASGWDVGAARVEIGDPTLASEIGQGIDLFGRLTNDQVRLELAGFLYRIDDFVTLQHLPLGCDGLDYRVRPDRDFPQCVRYSATDASMLGGEGLIEALLTPTTRLRASYDQVTGTRLEGDREPLAFIPPAHATMGIHQELGAWFVGSTARWSAPQNRVPAEELPTPSYRILNLEAGTRIQRGGQHLVTIRVDNALDAVYSDHLSVIRRYPSPVSPENSERFAMPGRNIHVAYRYVF